MKSAEISIERLQSECRAWAETIKAEYSPDLLIYVAKAGFLVMHPMIEVFKAPYVGIEATRKGNSLKSMVSPFISKTPRWIRNSLIFVELKSGIHKKNVSRNVLFHNSIVEFNSICIKNILIIDDSVDTGHSMLSVYNAVKERFPNAIIKSAALNVWDKSKEIFETDYALYNNVIIKSPMSKDSKEYEDFIRFYLTETNDGEK